MSDSEEQKTEVSRRARLKKALNEFEMEFFKTVSTMIGSAFALVAALAWNSTIEAVISNYVAKGNSFKSQLIYALVVTFLAVIITWQMGKIAAKFAADNVSEELKKEKDKK